VCHDQSPLFVGLFFHTNSTEYTSKNLDCSHKFTAYTCLYIDSIQKRNSRK
jgi:hypothetical protein